MPRAPSKNTKHKSKNNAHPPTPRKPKRVAEKRTAYAPTASAVESSPAAPPHPEILDRPYKTLTREEKWEWHKALAQLPVPEPRFYGIIFVDDVEVWRGDDCDVMMDEYIKLRDQYPDRDVAFAWLDAAPIQIYAIISL